MPLEPDPIKSGEVAEQKKDPNARATAPNV